MNIKIADFFCGIGGLRLGFELASDKYQCVFSNDIDKYCQKVYCINFSDSTFSNINISNLKIDIIPDFDVFVGGFPCQPFSIAGKQKGFQDSRGNVFYDIIRILKEKKPKVFLLENVKNLKTHDNGKTFKIMKKELIKSGYFFKTKILNTADYANIPQNRERLFMVGFLNYEHAKNFNFPSKLVLNKDIRYFLEKNIDNKYYYKKSSAIYSKLENVVKRDINTTNQVYQYRRHHVRENKSNLCPTLTANMGSGGHNVPIINDGKGIRKLTPRECFSLQGFPSYFILPNDISDSQLYKQSGNSVTVKLIKRIAIQILKVLENKW
jgi:DNA (cytosine-5)-methyltransferase 1